MQTHNLYWVIIVLTKKYAKNVYYNTLKIKYFPAIPSSPASVDGKKKKTRKKKKKHLEISDFLGAVFFSLC